MSFDKEQDEKAFGRLIDGIMIGSILIVVITFTFIILSGCGTNPMKKDCVWVCPDAEAIPDKCYCLDSELSCDDHKP